jgi:light-harvesting complex I chlorophyll a/b binding protein 1
MSRSKSSTLVVASAATAGAVWASNAFVPSVQAPGLRGSPVRSGISYAAESSSSSSSTSFAGLAAGTAAAVIFLGSSRPGSVAARAFENELGATLPLKYFDPLGMSKDGDQDAFRRRRTAEIKNGRVAMWACMGYIAPEYSRWPGYCSPSQDIKFSDLPNGIAALYKVPAEGWAQIAIFIGFLELFPMRQEKDRIPGDVPGFGRFGLPLPSRADPEKTKRSLEAELNNGRLAMLAITGMVAQNGFFGTTGAAMWLPGASAFETELGVQAPVGFWDPLGLAKDGDADNFKRRRAVELKHGRICMLACTGYIVQEYFRFPGYLSPEKGIKFADIPSGIGAITKVPLEGWLQIGLFVGHYEGFFMRQDPSRPPGDFENYGFLGVGKNFIFNFDPPVIQDPEVRKRKLNAEIANGRLAMVALMAMLFQNGTVGTAGPAMWLPGSA